MRDMVESTMIESSVRHGSVTEARDIQEPERKMGAMILKAGELVFSWSLGSLFTHIRSVEKQDCRIGQNVQATSHLA
jgi:hypothetical protein